MALRLEEVISLSPQGLSHFHNRKVGTGDINVVLSLGLVAEETEKVVVTKVVTLCCY